MGAVGADGGAPHVLVVDDDELIRTIARAVLEKAGMRVTEAEDGARALAYLKDDRRVALVLLDLDMPNLGGMEVLRSIRALQSGRELPVAILTGSTENEEELAVMRSGANACIRKPIVPDQLLARVLSLLPSPGA